MFVYIIESTIAFSIIYSFYKYVFFQTTHFEWNRFYFYFAIVISAIIPLMKFPFSTNITTLFNHSSYMINPLDGTGLLVYSQNENTILKWISSLNSNSYLNLTNLFYIIYFSGIIRYLIIFIKNNIEILKLLKKAKLNYQGEFTIAEIPYNETAFSYFRFIFLGKKFKQLDKQEQDKVLAHEKVHAAQLHSFDILIYEIYEIIYWFNPYVKKAKITLKNLHEYIVDSEILSAEKHIKTNLANLFSKSPLRDRIKLLAFPESKKIKKLRFITGFPVLIMIIISYSFIISEINLSTDSLQFVNKEQFVEPVSFEGQLISGFFIKKKLTKEQNYNIIISHPEISYSTESFTEITATKNGKVTNIKETDNWGLKELEITVMHDKLFVSIYKGLWKAKVKQNDYVKKEQLIALTGDKRLYPSFSYQLLYKGKPVDPFMYINAD